MGICTYHIRRLITVPASGANGLNAVLELMDLMDDAAVGECSAFSGDAPRRLQAEFAGNSCGDRVRRFASHPWTFPSSPRFWFLLHAASFFLVYLFAFACAAFFLHVASP